MVNVRTKEEKLEIGRRIYEKEISKYEAAEIYDISVDTARNYLRMYRDSVGAPIEPHDVRDEDLERMSRRDLIMEIIRLRRDRRRG